MSTQRVYAYGIIRDAASGHRIPAVDGIAGERVRTVACGGLLALVSDVNPQLDDVFGTMQDPDRIKEMVLDHHRVLQGVANGHTVLPLRFGMVFTDETGIVTVLEAQRNALDEAIHRIEGAREWGVKLFCDHDVLRRRLEETSPTIRDMSEQMATASDGRAFFVRRQMQRTLDDEIDHAIDRCIMESQLALLPAVRDAATLETQPPAVHGRAADMVWNVSYLVPKDGEERFFASISTLKSAYRLSGFEYECTGPWPASSFAECRLGENNEPSSRQ